MPVNKNNNNYNHFNHYKHVHRCFLSDGKLTQCAKFSRYFLFRNGAFHAHNSLSRAFHAKIISNEILARIIRVKQFSILTAPYYFTAGRFFSVFFSACISF